MLEPSDIHVSLREYLEHSQKAQNDLVAQWQESHREIHTEAQRAVVAALEAINARLALLNELKQAMADQASRFATAEIVSTIDDRVSKIELFLSSISGQQVKIDTLHKDVETLKEFRSRFGGQTAMLAVAFMVLTVAIGFIIKYI